MKKYFSAKELKERIKSNDNRYTAQPYLLLLNQKRDTVGHPDYNYTRISYIEQVSGEYCEFETYEKAKEWLKTEYYECFDEEYKESDIQKIYINEVDQTVNVFLTDKGYKDHLQQNKHNLGKHTTYGIHAFRNKEIESLYNVIDEHIALQEQVQKAKEYIINSLDSLEMSENINLDYLVELVEKELKLKD